MTLKRFAGVVDEVVQDLAHHVSVGRDAALTVDGKPDVGIIDHGQIHNVFGKGAKVQIMCDRGFARACKG